MFKSNIIFFHSINNEKLESKYSYQMFKNDMLIFYSINYNKFELKYSRAIY
jgi:hypothetical protein